MALPNITPFFSRFPEKLDRLIYQFSRDPAIHLFVAFLVGFGLIVWSIMIGNFSVDFNGVISDLKNLEVAGKAVERIEIQEFINSETLNEKQVGYVFSLNWGFTGVILIPLMILFVLNARGSIEKTLSQLATRHMLRKQDGEVVTTEEICASWKQRSRVWIMISFFVFLFVVFFSMWDFMQVVHTPLYKLEQAFIPANQYVDNIQDGVMSISINHKVNEFDWSVAALFDNTVLSHDSNFWFSLFAYIWIAAIGGGIGFASIAYLIGFGTFIRAKSLEAKDIYLVLDQKSKDEYKRGGFEVFEDYFTNLIALCIVLLIILYLINTQNIYLRDVHTENFFQFILGDVAKQLSALHSDLSVNFSDITKWFFAKASGSDSLPDNVQSVIASISAPFVIIFIFALQFYILRSSSQDAKENTLQLIENDDDVEKIETIHYWPVGWVSLERLFFVSVTILASFIFFRILVGLLIYLAAKAIFRIIPKF